MAAKTEPKGKSGSLQNDLKPRPPVVVVVGHVDHGKTTLLDYIRKTNIAGHEAGGITQAVGSYEITHEAAGGAAPRKITFIDTPGHEAFTAMRSRGAMIADLAVLVVAADEGVKPQTKEAIDILQRTKTPFVVALNKIDKVRGGDLEKAKGDLAAAGVMLEGYGGQVSWHGISAKTGEGVGDLLDLILLAADVEGLSADPSAQAAGYILEARRDPRRGLEASVIIKDGTLHRGDAVKTRTASGKVKILEDFCGNRAEALGPSAPAVVIGFEALPNAGEEFVAGNRELVGSAVPPAGATAAPGNGATTGKTLNLIIKASDAGSLEALETVLNGVKQPEEKSVSILERAVGDVTDGDVKHAIATGATIIGFKNKVEKGAAVLADAQGVSVITSKIVYDLAKAVEDFLAGAGGSAAAGELEVLAVFNGEKLDKQLIGGRVAKGNFRAKAQFEILRAAAGSGVGGNDAATEAGAKGVGAGRVLSLREKKTEIAQAPEGKEIGVLVGASVPIQAGDRLIIKK